MGRVESVAQKKKTSKPSENHPASRAEIPSTSGRVETIDPEIQTQAHLRNAIRPDVKWYLAPPSTITARMISMPSEEMFDMYSAPDAPASKKKASRQHRDECSKEPLAKKTHTEEPPAAGPSKTTAPPPSPLEQQTRPAPLESTPSPPAPVDQTQPAAPVQTGDDISSHTL
ncbi:predicted GPI-anchored protein 58 [Humulus lupulus]|uniref:predicted GPI-anchored protein 58 n=1 Tax=Humulus lupulus TaxID=3486 RepID=UPI002B40DC88|nr:predicted GPI-anchored protein 58 [Humulus lupulus]